MQTFGVLELINLYPHDPELQYFIKVGNSTGF